MIEAFAGFHLPALVALLSLGADDPSDAPAACPAGRETRLEIQPVARPKFLAHDQWIGRDKLILKGAGPGARELFSLELDDAWWRCLAFDPGTNSNGRYVVGALGESGAWLVLRSVSYLAEHAPKLQLSSFTKKRYLAMASVASSDGRYLAFVGGVGGVDGLYVLDTRRDVIRRLGAPPAPPPVEDFDSEEPFEWGTGWADGYVVLEPSVMQFQGPDVLVVTYGKDTHKARAKKRTVRRFKL